MKTYDSKSPDKKDADWETAARRSHPGHQESSHTMARRKWANLKILVLQQEVFQAEFL